MKLRKDMKKNGEDTYEVDVKLGLEYKQRKTLNSISFFGLICFSFSDIFKK